MAKPFIIAVEGLDGAGKNTLANYLVDELSEDYHVKTISFPRYGTKYADLASQALHGTLGDTKDSVWAMAILFALDRYEACADISECEADILIIDRYVASNAAYSLARSIDHDVVKFISKLEFGEHGLPKPDVTLLVDTPPKTAQARVDYRADTSQRQRDAYENDYELQVLTYYAYQRLANDHFGGKWLTFLNDDGDVIDEGVFSQLKDMLPYPPLKEPTLF